MAFLQDMISTIVIFMTAVIVFFMLKQKADRYKTKGEKNMGNIIVDAFKELKPKKDVKVELSQKDKLDKIELELKEARKKLIEEENKQWIKPDIKDELPRFRIPEPPPIQELPIETKLQVLEQNVLVMFGEVNDRITNIEQFLMNTVHNQK